MHYEKVTSAGAFGRDWTGEDVEAKASWTAPFGSDSASRQKTLEELATFKLGSYLPEAVRPSSFGKETAPPGVGLDCIETDNHWGQRFNPGETPNFVREYGFYCLPPGPGSLVFSIYFTQVSLDSNHYSKELDEDAEKSIETFRPAPASDLAAVKP